MEIAEVASMAMEGDSILSPSTRVVPYVASLRRCRKFLRPLERRGGNSNFQAQRAGTLSSDLLRVLIRRPGGPVRPELPLDPKVERHHHRSGVRHLQHYGARAPGRHPAERPSLDR